MRLQLITTSIIAYLGFVSFAQADCVYGAKDKTSYLVLDSHSILLQGGPGHDMIIKTYSFLSKNIEITVLKDSFCSYENAVLYVDGEVIDASQVTKVD